MTAAEARAALWRVLISLSLAPALAACGDTYAQHHVLPGSDIAWPPMPPAPPPSSSSSSHAASAPSAPLPATPAPEPPVEADPLLIRSARLLAGLSVDPPSSVATRAAQAQARRLAPIVKEYVDDTGTPMQAWAATELSSAAGQTVFYPFSGPDFLTIHRLYPAASRYVLVALQEGGPPPVVERMSERTAQATLRVHANAIQSFTQKGFFITAKLGKGYSVPGAWTGITGMLMAFAAIEGFEVIHAAPLSLVHGNDDVVVGSPDDRAVEDWNSVRLTLRGSDGKIVLLDYLDLDLSNTGLPHGSPALAFIERSATEHVLIKAASHLPQFPPFFELRDVLLERSRELVQDETGVRYADLTERFSTTLYGRFVGVNRLFDPRPQRALKAAYQQRTDIKPLPFGIGYHKPAGSCLIVARRL